MVIVSLVLIFVIIFYFSLFNIKIEEYIKYVLALKEDAYNEPLLDLLQGNTLVNLPNVQIVTNDEYITNLQECKQNAVYMGPDNGSDYLDTCKTKCGGVGELMVIGPEDEYYQDSSKLEPGVYCTLNPPQCNLNTSYVLATANSTVCRSKYPNMFGGPTGGYITACNNEIFPSTGSVLWDYSNNEQVYPNTVVMSHEDEKLPDGSYRFRCKFSETASGNPYIPNPVNRFHPLEDKCNKTIYRADYSVHANVTDTSWDCDCGSYETTRVKHLDENNIQSTCTSCFFESTVIDEAKGYKKAKIPFLCFNQNSVWKLALQVPPCVDLPANGNTCGQVTLDYKQGLYEVNGNYHHYPEDYGGYTNDFLPIDINESFSRRVQGARDLDTR